MVYQREYRGKELTLAVGVIFHWEGELGEDLTRVNNNKTKGEGGLLEEALMLPSRPLRAV